MGISLIPYKEWMQRTAVVARPRSPELKALDQALERHEKFGGGDALWRLEQALTKWKAKQGPGDAWKKSIRNKKDQAVEELTARLAGKGDTDKGKGEAPDYLHPQLVHARLGVIYLLGHTKVDSNLFNVILEGGLSVASSGLSYAGAKVSDGGLGRTPLSTIDMNLTTAMVPGKLILDAGESAVYSAKSASERTLLERVRTWFADFAAKVWESVKQKFGSVDFAISALKNLVNVCLKVFAEAAAPFVSAGIDIAKGVVNTLDSAMTRFRTWQRGKGVQILSGHPGTIVNSIKEAMNLSICEGLWQTLKGAGNMALTGATAGVGAIVGIVVALSEMIVKMIWRMVEIARMDKFFGQAAEHWKQRNDPNSLHRRPFAFASWYKSAALTIPAISVLTLNSGICGDKMHFLQIHKDDGNIVGTDDFQRGCAFVDGLKSWGATYLGKCGYAFSSPDKMVSSLISFASGNAPESAPKHPALIIGAHASQGNRIWGGVVKVMNA